MELRLTLHHGTGLDASREQQLAAPFYLSAGHGVYVASCDESSSSQKYLREPDRGGHRKDFMSRHKLAGKHATFQGLPCYLAANITFHPCLVDGV